MIRDHIHLIPKAFDIAGYVVSYLGLFQYTSAHIRRNDFQFKGSWIPASKSINNIKTHFDNPKEILYIASDASPEFFKNITDVELYRWHDFFNKNGTLYKKFNNKFPNIELDEDNINRKIIALIEMIICSGGKRFFGTVSSTYSAYITRLRGYMDAPDKDVWFHNKPNKHEYHFNANEYMIEHKEMWDDIKDYC